MRFIVREIKIACPHCGETCDVGPELVTLFSASRVAQTSAPSTSIAQASRRAAARAYQKAYYRKKVKKAAKARKAKREAKSE